jgi:hypothetical protein
MNQPSYAGASVKIVIGIISVGALITVNFGFSEVRYIRQDIVSRKKECLQFITHRMYHLSSDHSAVSLAFYPSSCHHCCLHQPNILI